MRTHEYFTHERIRDCSRAAGAKTDVLARLTEMSARGARVLQLWRGSGLPETYFVLHSLAFSVSQVALELSSTGAPGPPSQAVLIAGSYVSAACVRACVRVVGVLLCVSACVL